MKNDVIPTTLYQGITAIHGSCLALTAATAFYVQKEKKRGSAGGCSETAQNRPESWSTQKIHMPRNTAAWSGVGCFYIL